MASHGVWVKPMALKGASPSSVPSSTPCSRNTQTPHPPTPSYTRSSVPINNLLTQLGTPPHASPQPTLPQTTIQQNLDCQSAPRPAQHRHKTARLDFGQRANRFHRTTGPLAMARHGWPMVMGWSDQWPRPMAIHVWPWALGQQTS